MAITRWLLLITLFIAVCSTQQKAPDVFRLNEDNWQEMLSGEWMIEFFAPWCPACKNLAPTWEHFAKIAKEVNVNVANIDVTISPSLSGRFFVTALPTIYHVKDGEFRQYRGSREADSLLLFIKKQHWTKIQPVSAWKKPDTIHMSILSYFFKLSHTLKELNTRLQEEYGLPTWGSYALFAVGTIFVGAALGLVLVCLVDLVYPPKKSQRQSFSESKDNINESLEDLATEEIVDDPPENDQDQDEEEDEEDDADGEGEEYSSSDEEKNSQSESDAGDGDENADEVENVETPKSEKTENIKKEAKPLTPLVTNSEVRKRKPAKKAD